MHVAQNLISLTFDSTEISGLEALSTDESIGTPDAFNFAAVLQTNISESGPAGGLLPLDGSELPSGLVPEDTDVATIGESLADSHAPLAEIVASMNVAPALAQAQATTLSPADRANRVELPLPAKPGFSHTLPHTLTIESLVISNQAGAEIVASMVPEIGAALRPAELAGLKLINGNMTANRGLGAAASTATAIADDLPLLTDSVNNRLSTQPAVATIATGLDGALDLNGRLINQTSTQNLSHVASPASFIHSATAERPSTPAFELTTTTIATPVRDTAWGDRISQQVLTMATAKTQVAEIRLTPAELGPLRVQIDVDERMANVTFQSQHAATREAIELAMPRLRELLAENGLTLGQADVSEREDTYREQGLSDGTKDDAQSTDESEGRTDAEEPKPSVTRVNQSLLDAFV